MTAAAAPVRWYGPVRVALLLTVLFTLSGCGWVVSTVNSNVVTCVWDDDTSKVKTVNLDAFAAQFLAPGDDCPESDQ